MKKLREIHAYSVDRKLLHNNIYNTTKDTLCEYSTHTVIEQK